MKQNLLTLLKSRIWLLVTLFMLSANTFAADEEKTITPIDLDKSYHAPAFEYCYYSLVAPKSGLLTIIGDSYCPTPYTDKTFTTQLSGAEPHYVGDGVNREMTVVKGQTYYFMTYSYMSTGSDFKLTMDENVTLEVTRVNPETDKVFDLTNGGGVIDITFNKSISIGSATLSSGTTTASAYGNVSGAGVVFELKSTIFNWLKNGTIHAGDNLTLTIKDVCMKNDKSVKYGTDGTLVLNWLAPALPTEMLTENVPDKFLSFWPAGDPAGVVKFEFSSDINKDDVPTATVSFGNREKEGEFYNEIVPVTVDGKTVTVDLTDKQRTKKIMLPNATSDYTSISLKLANVKNSEGDYVYSSGQGSLGSFTYNMAYEDVSKDIVAQFTPATGSSIEKTDEIELWISDKSAITYSGVNFKYTHDGIREDIKVASKDIPTTEVDDGLALTITVPEEVKTATNVVLTLTDLVSADGLDRSTQLSARYNTLKVTMLKPTETTLAGFVRGDEILLSTNMNAKIGYMKFNIKDLTDGSIAKSSSDFYQVDAKDPNSDFGFQFYGPIKLLEGHTYSMNITAYAHFDDPDGEGIDYSSKEPLDTTSIIFKGTTPPFKFSTVKYVGIDPDPETTILESVKDNTFTITFDGPVNLDPSTTFCTMGYGQTNPFESITPLDEGATKYSKVWRLKVAESYLEDFTGNALTFSVVPKDEDGLLVEGNTGSEEGSFLNFSYTTTIGVPDLVISPASGETVLSLKEFAVDCEEGINWSGWIGMKTVIVTGNDGAEVAHLASAVQYIPEEELDNYDYQPTRVTLTLDKEITTPGTYTLTIPADAFIFGNQMSTMNSKTTTATYIVATETGISGLINDKASKYDVYTIGGTSVMSTTNKADIDRLNSGLYIINGKKVIIKK